MKARNNRSEDRQSPSRGGSSYNKPSYNGFNILPSARVLEEYESAAPGSINKLVDMAKKEQEHRHSWQDRYLRSHNLTYRAGQLFGFSYNILLLYVIYSLIRGGNSAMALKLFVINSLLLAFAIVATYTERKLTTRKPPRRTGFNEGNRSGAPRRNHNSNQNRSRENSGNREPRQNRRPDNNNR